MRPIIIQKFGGTSLQKSDLRQAAIQHVKAMVAKQKAVVMVVSALGRLGDPYATDSLLELVHGQTGKLNFQELDQLTSLGETISMLVMVNELRQQGLDAVGLSGGQAGIQTTTDYQAARITHVDPRPINRALANHEVVVVAGFQGQTAIGKVTTLGRGGSDTTAVALGVALKADQVILYKNVAGVMHTDPTGPTSARVISWLSYPAMIQLARKGAQVVCERAVLLAAEANLPIWVQATDQFDETVGTLISSAMISKKRRVI